MKRIRDEVKDNPELKRLDEFLRGLSIGERYAAEHANAVIDFYNEGYETATAGNVILYAGEAGARYTRKTFARRMAALNHWWKFLGREERVTTEQARKAVDRTLEKQEEDGVVPAEKQASLEELWYEFEQAHVCARLLKAGKATIVTTEIGGKTVRYTRRK